jgi:hypothetical protein
MEAHLRSRRISSNAAEIATAFREISYRWISSMRLKCSHSSRENWLNKKYIHVYGIALSLSILLNSLLTSIPINAFWVTLTIFSSKERISENTSLIYFHSCSKSWAVFRDHKRRKSLVLVENQDPAKPKLINRPFEQLAFVAVGY